MKKSAIALAVAAALGVSGASQAETTLYGSARVSVDYVNPDISRNYAEFFDINRNAFWQVTNNSSRLGVRGSEDLGRGLSAIYQYEFGIDVTGNTNYFNSNRPRWVGLKGNWGAVTLGTQWTPYYNVIGVFDTFNSGRSFSYYLAGSSLNGVPLTVRRGNAEFRRGSSVVYNTPNWRGLKLEGMIEMNGIAERSSIDAWEINLTYENGPFFAGAAYAVDKVPNAEFLQPNDKQFTAAIAYRPQNWGIGIGYQRYKPDDSFEPFCLDPCTSDAFLTIGQETINSINIQGNYNFGNNIIRATFGKTDVDNVSGDLTVAELGFQHNFSKRTRIWLEGFWFKQDQTDFTVVTDIDGFPIGVPGTTGDDQKGWAVSIGTRHDF